MESKTGRKTCRQDITKQLFSFIMLFIGAASAAFAIEEFLVPCTILDGGIVGISIMINNLSGISLSILTICLNLPFLAIGYKVIGLDFVIKSGFSMSVFSIFVEVFNGFRNATDEYLLAVSFGGLLLGLGVGIVIRFGGCLDGTETLAILLNRKFGLQVGQVVLFFNIIIYSIAGILFGLDRAMYSLLTYIVTSKVLDYVETGIEQAKAAMIITNEGSTITDSIYHRLGRTVTIIEGEGLISGKKVILYCVLSRFEIYELKKIIREVDESAFIAVSDVSEIIGHHIKKSEHRQPKDMETETSR